jgi:hypothetical protein
MDKKARPEKVSKQSQETPQIPETQKPDWTERVNNLAQAAQAIGILLLEIARFFLGL